VKKIIVTIASVVLLMSMTYVRAGEYSNSGYFGGKLGVNTSSATGATNATSERTLAYGLQGGYLQGGYVFESKTLVFAAGVYLDGNPSEQHNPPTGIRYGSRSYGVDVKVGLPLGPWMPYSKLGYGYSTGTRDLNTVAGNGLNAAFGMEYKIAPQWSLLGEYKSDSFGSKSGETSIKNKIITFGFNYYFQAPPLVIAPVIEEVEEVETAPKPIIVPVPVDDAPPI
jgi:Outer membrane protein beta-barrel domain